MNVFICKWCDQVKKSQKSLTGHETFCKDNPNHKIQTTTASRKRSSRKVNCQFCNIEHSKFYMTRHETCCIKNPLVIAARTKICPTCNNAFMSGNATCSYACSNSYFRHSREDGARYLEDSVLIENGRYRDLCFRHHKKECVVCGEFNIVAVHHINEDHYDNRPDNLVPLCPTHHLYCHSAHKDKVIDIINNYMILWKTKNN
jgi:hypothetical protein